MTRWFFGLVASLAAGLVAGCILPQFPDSATGCSPQVPLGYRIQAAVPQGRLEITVVDGQQAPLASRSVTAHRVAYSAQCVSAVHGTTGRDGKVAFDRLKTGDYLVMLDAADGAGGAASGASASARVLDGQTTAVTLADAGQP